MTMRIVFNKDFDGYKKDKEYYVERTLAIRFCQNSTATPYQKHLDNIYDAEQAAKKVVVEEVEEVEEEPVVEEPAKPAYKRKNKK